MKRVSMTMIVVLAAVVLLAICLTFQLVLRGAQFKQFAVDVAPDEPKPFGYKMAWLAIQTEDTRALAELLGLENQGAANWNSGIGTIYDDALGASYIYLTPPVSGWSFVVGLTLPHPVGSAFVDKLTPLMLSLGQHFPDVQYFFTYPLIDFFSWARVKDGKLLRAFAVNDEGVVWNKGRITPEERALGLRLFELRGVQERQGDTGGEMVLYPTEDQVLQIAKCWSLDPTQVAATDTGDGCGVVAPAPSAWCSERRRKKAA
jgi:hypothetical protein